MAKNSKTKPLSHLADKNRGAVHHIEIHPARNSSGGMGFITRIHRNRPPAAEAAMQSGGPYTPSPEPQETVHEDGGDMMDHVGKQLGVPAEGPEPDADEE